MEHTIYIARKRARFEGISGPVNIPFGTRLEARDGFLFHNEQPLCTITGQNAYDYFSQDDDGQGRVRGGLVAAIIAHLEERDAEYQARWNKVWAAPICQGYRRAGHEDFWLWNHEFYNAPINNLQYIAELIDARAN